MPVLDWTVLILSMKWPHGSKRYVLIMAFAAFELYILKRLGEQRKLTHRKKAEAKAYFDQMSEADIAKLTKKYYCCQARI